MSRLPRITGREVVAALRKAGFDVARVKGSHHFLRHTDGRGTVVPVHSGETLGPGLLAAILRDCEISAMTSSHFCSERGVSASNITTDLTPASRCSAVAGHPERSLTGAEGGSGDG